MVVIEIEDNKGNTIGGIRIFENDENSDVNIVNTMGDISIADIDFDDLFDTNDKKIRVWIDNYDGE